MTYTRGVIRFNNGIEATYEIVRGWWIWQCSNKVIQAVLNIAYGQLRFYYPPEYLVHRAAQVFKATVVELPVDQTDWVAIRGFETQEYPRGEILILGHVKATFDLSHEQWGWRCPNKVFEFILTWRFDRFLSYGPADGYPAAYMVKRAARFFRAKIIQMPEDRTQYPPDVFF
jgi:hypothetical protein